MNNFHKSHLKPWGLELVAKYPLIFTEADPENAAWAHRAGVKEADYVNLRYGFECNEGWAKKIEEIAKKATEIVTYLRDPNLHCMPLPPEKAYIHSCIVKEKFGGLRWQGTANLPPLFQDLWYPFYARIENETYHVCEMTGEFGVLRRTKNGEGCWQRTLSTEKALELGYDIEDWEKERIERLKNPPVEKPKEPGFVFKVPSKA